MSARKSIRRPARREVVTAGGVGFSVLRARPETAGSQPPVLLLHGVPQTAMVWRDLLAALPARDVLAPDLKGLGATPGGGDYDIPSLVGELAALLEAVLAESGSQPPVDVVGHDWGGALAIALCGARPDLVRRLVVANAPYREIDLRRAWYMPLFATPVLPEVLLRVAGRQFWGRIFDLAWKGPQPLDAGLRAHYLDVYTRPETISAMLAYYRVTTRARLRAMPRRLLHGVLDRPVAAPRAAPAEALVVWGTADPAFPRSIGEGVARDLGAQWLPVEGSGHFVVEENPAVVVPAVVSFLETGSLPDAGPGS